jgi:hypothetical protein
MNKPMMLIAILAVLLFCSCTQNQTSTTPESGNRHATVIMLDGAKTAGTVVKSSDAEITIAGDDKITRTIPMNQVRSVEYSDVAAEPTAESTAPPAEKAAAPISKAAAQMSKAAPETSSSRPESRPTYELTAGTNISVRTDETIDSSTAAEGKVYGGNVSKDVLNDAGVVVIPKGSNAQIEIISASQGGRIRGASDLVLTLKSITVGGKRYGVESENISQQGRDGIGKNKRTATFTGGGAAVGAIIGAIAGGGKGAAIGAASGAGAGALTQILTKGKSIRVPVETILTFQLDRSLRMNAER